MTARLTACLVALCLLGPLGSSGGQSMPGIVDVSPAMKEILRGPAALRVLPASIEEKSAWYVRYTFNAASLLLPALPAAIIMADPLDNYPREWRQGGAAFGRNFGDCLATAVAANTGKYLSGLVTHEDPRYYPDRSKSIVHRTLYALAFTVVDRSDLGRPRIAYSNFAGSVSAGFIGRLYLPNGFDDTVHAGQRTGGTLGGYVPTLLVGYATSNLALEFSPDLKRLARKLHLPFVPN